MNTKLTDRDKKLLAGLGVFLVALVLGVLVIMPLYAANVSMKEEIRANEWRMEEVGAKVEALPAVRAGYEEREEALAAAQEDLYPMLRSKDIDRLLTEKAFAWGLSARKLQIAMPKEAASVTGYLRENDDGSNPDALDGIWIAQAKLQVEGSVEGMDGLIDELSLHMPGVRVTRLLWGQSRRQVDAASGRTEPYDTLNLEVEILMSRKE